MELATGGNSRMGATLPEDDPTSLRWMWAQSGSRGHLPRHALITALHTSQVHLPAGNVALHGPHT